nr:unnamed protein product [Digitaria exilis]
MRATGEHTAAVPIPAPPPPPPPMPPSAVEEAEKEKRKNRRRPTRRSKQQQQQGAAPTAAPQGGPHADAAGPVSVRSMPPMHVGGGARADAEAEASAAGTSHSWPLLPTPRPAEALVPGADQHPLSPLRTGTASPPRYQFQILEKTARSPPPPRSDPPPPTAAAALRRTTSPPIPGKPTEDSNPSRSPSLRQGFATPIPPSAPARRLVDRSAPRLLACAVHAELLASWVLALLHAPLLLSDLFLSERCLAARLRSEI